MNERLRKALPVIAGAVGFSAGGALGYILARRKGRLLMQEFADMVEKEFATHERVVKLEELDLSDGDYPSAETVVGTLTFIERAPLGLATGLLATGLDEEVVKNIFENDDDWDYEAEANTRDGKSIYVIHRDEFIPDEMGYRQSTVTWYEGDKILADERDAPIYNWSSIVGTDLPFGHGSGDANVVYIRNEELRHEYEVLKDPGRFDVEVEGHQIEQDFEDQEIRHSKTPLKFRQE